MAALMVQSAPIGRQAAMAAAMVRLAPIVRPRLIARPHLMPTAASMVRPAPIGRLRLVVPPHLIVPAQLMVRLTLIAQPEPFPRSLDLVLEPYCMRLTWRSSNSALARPCSANAWVRSTGIESFKRVTPSGLSCPQLSVVFWQLSRGFVIS